MNKKNKVQFNLKNVHYAVKGGTADAPVYEKPVHVPGAVSLTLDPQGNVTPFYADGVVYYNSIANNGYSGDLEMALFPDQMLADIWGFEMPEDNVITENSMTEPKDFALLYQIDGDKNNDYYCLYSCSGTRPAIGGSTVNADKTPNTRSSTITATPLESGLVHARTTSDTTDAVKSAWFDQVYQPAAVTA